MAINFYRAQVTLPYVTGLPRDVAINTFTFAIEDTLAGAPEVTDAIVSFYNLIQDPGPTTNVLSDYLSAYIDRSTDACTIEYYDWEAPLGSSAVTTAQFTLLPTPEDASLPFEVAVCTSFVAQTAPGPVARRRGRVYIGPLTVGATSALDDQPARVDDALQRVLVAATQSLTDTDGVDLAIWSRVDEAAKLVTGGWVDNEFDTQRRRQVEASSRLTWSNLV